jgi:hypothetical protein
MPRKKPEGLSQSCVLFQTIALRESQSKPQGGCFFVTVELLEQRMTPSGFIPPCVRCGIVAGSTRADVSFKVDLPERRITPSAFALRATALENRKLRKMPPI